MTAGNITRRGKESWRIKFEAGPRDQVSGKRQTRVVTVHGSRRDAQRELTRLLAEIDNGTAVAPSKITVAEYLRDWLDKAAELAPKTRERYRQLVEQQVLPHLGLTTLQKLRPAQIADWHQALLVSGGKDGKPLSARTVGHAHRVLATALERAVRLELVGRNVARAVPPPKVEPTEIEILNAEQIADVLAKLKGYGGRYGHLPLHAIATLALGTGMRRGEICALVWAAVDLKKGTVRVDRSLEETSEGLRFKSPKTKHGRRTINLPRYVIDVLDTHRRQLLEYRLAVGLGRLGDADLVFPTLPDWQPYAPNKLSRDWGHAVRDRKLPATSFHALRHSHASALIDGGLDIVSVSRRLGHANPQITLRVYAHAFSVDKDQQAARVMAALMDGGR